MNKLPNHERPKTVAARKRNSTNGKYVRSLLLRLEAAEQTGQRLQPMQKRRRRDERARS